MLKFTAGMLPRYGISYPYVISRWLKTTSADDAVSDVTLIVSVTTTHSNDDVLVKLFQEDVAGTANDIVTINEHLD